jgi:hypothetical protein
MSLTSGERDYNPVIPAKAGIQERGGLPAAPNMTDGLYLIARLPPTLGVIRVGDSLRFNNQGIQTSQLKKAGIWISLQKRQ